jgi:hypothetical protein
LDRTFREAEQAGLRIAIKGRLVALVLLGAYLVVSRIANPEHALELGRVWLKYAFITLDIAVLSLLMATQPIFDTVDVPQALSFRNPVFPFYFVILGVAAFSFSPGLVLWSGMMGAAGWLGAFAWAVRDMPVRFDWSDIGIDLPEPRFHRHRQPHSGVRRLPGGGGVDRRRHVAGAAHGAPAAGAG